LLESDRKQKCGCIGVLAWYVGHDSLIVLIELIDDGSRKAAIAESRMGSE
jgi:hypothetical protein